MIKENRVSKYLLYAIGEIVLVVIGILIALQVNDRNELSKRQDKELSLLREMRDNLQSDSVSIAIAIRRVEYAKNASEAVLYQLEEGIPWHDSMEVHYATLNFGTLSGPVRSAYENFKSIGFDLIQNDSLRSQINQLYEQQQPFVIRIEQEFSLPTRNFVMTPELKKKVRTIEARKRARPIDPLSLLTDHEFQEALRMNIGTHEVLLWAYGEMVKVNTQLAGSLKTELEGRE